MPSIPVIATSELMIKIHPNPHSCWGCKSQRKPSDLLTSAIFSIYPLVNVYIAMENHYFNGTIHYKWPFSLANGPISGCQRKAGIQRPQGLVLFLHLGDDLLRAVGLQLGMGQNPVPLVNPKIAGKWMFIPLKMVLIGIDPYPDLLIWCNQIKHTIYTLPIDSAK